MSTVILWKEYRQQRALWLAMAALAVLLALGSAGIFARGSGWEIFQEDRVRVALAGLVVGLTLAYGVVCGALLLAGEKEEATLVFLDGLAGLRHSLWRAKLLAGVLLTLPLALALAVPALGFISVRTALW